MILVITNTSFSSIRGSFCSRPSIMSPIRWDLAVRFFFFHNLFPLSLSHSLCLPIACLDPTAYRSPPSWLVAWHWSIPPAPAGRRPIAWPRPPGASMLSWPWPPSRCHRSRWQDRGVAGRGRRESRWPRGRRAWSSWRGGSTIGARRRQRWLPALCSCGRIKCSCYGAWGRSSSHFNGRRWVF